MNEVLYALLEIRTVGHWILSDHFRGHRHAVNFSGPGGGVK